MRRQKTAAAMMFIVLFLAPAISFGARIDSMPGSGTGSEEITDSQGDAITSQGQGSDAAIGQNSSQEQAGQDTGQGDTLQEEEQDRDRLQDGTGDQEQTRERLQEEIGEGNGAQIQNQNQEENQIELEKSTEKKSERSINRRNQIANAMQEMEKIAANNGETGAQLKVMAQNQNNDQDSIENSLEKAQDRNSVIKFLIGPNYGKLNEVEEKIQEQENRIQQMQQLANQLENEGDAQKVMEQIKVMNEVKAELEQELEVERRGFSLFGWLFKWIS